MPFIWGIHEAPRDFFRFTPYGLDHILRAAGFVDVEITAICGYWSTTGIRFAYHMHRLEGGRVPRPLLFFLQVAAQRVGYRLDQWNHEEADSAGYVVVASKAEPQ